MCTAESDPGMSRLVPGPARRLASRLDALFGQDAALARRLDAAQEQLHRANDRLWSGLHPDGLATVYDQDPAAIDLALDVHRSEVLGARDPLAAVQQVHWQSDRAFIANQTVAEERRQLAAEIGELIRQFVDALVAAGWSEEQARNTDVRELASNKPATQRRHSGWEQHSCRRP
jgi:hypothetical protein